MNIRVLVVGKLAPMYAAMDVHYRKMLGRYHSIELLELSESKHRRSPERKSQEAERILHQTRSFILCDETGRDMSTAQWADWFGSQPGNTMIDVVIGGADGVSEDVKKKAQICWRLSSLTLPHQMARVLLLEQLYRVSSILAHHPYHRS